VYLGVGRVESTLALEENKAQNPGTLGAKLSWVSERKRGIEKRFSSVQSWQRRAAHRCFRLERSQEIDDSLLFLRAQLIDVSEVPLLLCAALEPKCKVSIWSGLNPRGLP
jgi:hypothetical protein